MFSKAPTYNAAPDTEIEITSPEIDIQNIILQNQQILEMNKMMLEMAASPITIIKGAVEKT